MCINGISGYYNDTAASFDNSWPSAPANPHHSSSMLAGSIKITAHPKNSSLLNPL